MQTAQDKSAIDRMLQSHGLGRLEDGAGLMSQLGFLVQDHERSLAQQQDADSMSTGLLARKLDVRTSVQAVERVASRRITATKQVSGEKQASGRGTG